MNCPEHISDLISDLTFYRDLKEDLRWNEATMKMLFQLESSATNLLMEQLELQRGNLPVNVIVAGNFNAGKSSFINSLLNEELCCVGSRPITAAITRFHYGDTERIVLHSGREINRDDYLKISRHNTENIIDEGKRQIDYYYPLEKLRDISITDTPGFSSSVMHENDSRLTMDYCRMADAVILVININDGTVGEDLLQKIRALQADEPSPPWYLVVNWADSKPEFKAHKILEHLQNEFSKYFQDFFLYSAKPEFNSKNAIRQEAVFHLLRNLSRQKKKLLQQKSDRFARKYQQMRSLHLKKLHECMRFVNSNELNEQVRSKFCGELKTFLRQELKLSPSQTGRIIIEQIEKIPENFKNLLCEYENKNASDKDFCAYLLSEVNKIFKPRNHASFKNREIIEKEELQNELCSKIDFCNGFWTRQQQLRQKTCRKIKLFLQNCA